MSAKTNTVMREYSNDRNGGKERVYREGDNYYIDSNWGKGFLGDLIPVSRQDMRECLEFTKAPQAVKTAILG